LAHERMSCSDFVVAVGTDEEKIAELGPAQQVVEQIEGRGVEPLQVVEEKCERMFRPSEHPDELAKHQLEAPLRVLRWQLGDRRRFADNELHLGNEIDDQSCVRSQCVLQGVAPGRKVCFALAEEWPGQILKSLCQRRVGNVAFVLIELAGREYTARRD